MGGIMDAHHTPSRARARNQIQCSGATYHYHLCGLIWPMKICISWSEQWSETAPHEKGFLCSLCGLVWKQHTKSLLHNASYHCLELPCGSVPASPLPQLFRPQSQRAPPFCLLWPGVNRQTMTRWANVHQVTPSVAPFPISLLDGAQGDYIISCP